VNSQDRPDSYILYTARTQFTLEQSTGCIWVYNMHTNICTMYSVEYIQQCVHCILHNFVYSEKYTTMCRVYSVHIHTFNTSFSLYSEGTISCQLAVDAWYRTRLGWTETNLYWIAWKCEERIMKYVYSVLKADILVDIHRKHCGWYVFVFVELQLQPYYSILDHNNCSLKLTCTTTTPHYHTRGAAWSIQEGGGAQRALFITLMTHLL